MTVRTQYLLFLTLWVGAICIGVFILKDLGLPFGDEDRLLILAVAPLAAGVGYALIRGCGSVIDKWRIRRGRDIHGERTHEDEDGYIHLFEVPESMKQRDIGASEMVKNLVLGEAPGPPDDSK